MKFIINNNQTNADSAITRDTRSGNAKYYEVVANVLLEWETKSATNKNQVVYSNTLSSLNKQIKNHITESNTSKHYRVTNSNTEKALNKLLKLKVITKAN